MATTPVYNWPLPDDTDLVKDGAEAIRDLGNAIDTTVSSVPTGLIHIKTLSTGGAVASVNLEDIFSADFDTYQIFFIGTTSTANVGMSARLRVGGTTESGTIYRRQSLGAGGASVTASRETNNTSFIDILIFQNNNLTFNYFEVFNPFLGIPTTASYKAYFNPSGNIDLTQASYGINNSTSYTALTMFPGSGTMNGNFTILGYKK
jgi:hypothetical protein